MDEPKSYLGIMVSSTFSDLKEHRQKVIESIQKHGFKANVMEHDGARADVDVIDSSLNMVRDSAAYISVISRKYGQTPESPDRNADHLSLTELEFNIAMELGRPILLFIMGPKHPITEADVELDPDRRARLDAFRGRAKRMRSGDQVERVWEEFNDLNEFATAAATAVGRLKLEPAAAMGKSAAVGAPSPAVAEGWETINAETLAERTATPPTAQEMSDWFSGSFPRWEAALAEGVRPRHKVEELAQLYDRAHHGAPRPIVRLLTGAGGEGKSAALLQTAGDLLRGARNWTCLWRSSAAAPLPVDLGAKLDKRPDHAWMIVIDDAENVAQGLPDLLRELQPRTDVHLILAARDADWSIRGLNGVSWGGADFQRVNLAGLDEDDARRIADGWIAYGDAAMGKLRGRTAEQAAHVLLGHAHEQAANPEEGALLGALLITREGENLKARVTRLMEPWRDAVGIGDKKLLDIYAMIAAMHAENQLYLSRAVLAFALGCDESALDRGPLRVLRREAMVDGGTTYVLTRHRQIAEAARDWLVETGYNVDGCYPVLANAAERGVSAQGRFNPDIAAWRFEMARRFVDKGPVRWPVAVAVARAVYEANSANAQSLTTYAGTLRRTGQPGEALRLLRAEGPRFPGRRDVLYEWSVAAGEAGDHGLAIWLAGRSLADDRSVELRPLQCKLSLAGLGAAFGEQAETTGLRVFVVARAACGRLGLNLQDLDPTARGFFDKHTKAAEPPEGKTPTIEADVETMRAAIVEASYEAEPANDPPFFEQLIGDPETYRFTMHVAALEGDGRSGGDGRARARRPRPLSG